MLLILPLFSIPAFSQNETCNFTDRTQFTFEDLVSLIKNPACNIKNIANVIEKLPKSMKKTTVLFNRSQSLQGPHTEDYVYPRAILNSLGFDKAYNNLKPGLALSFNGHYKQANYQGLEIMSVDPSKSYKDMFEYIDIQFPSDEESKTFSWQEIQGKIRFSEKNPAACQKCHGNPARPIFEQYPNWAGALGKRHTALLDENEKNGFLNFINRHKNDQNSRYYWLNLENFSADPFGSRMFGPGIIQSEKISFAHGEQNLNFNATLVDYNGIRVAKMMKESSIYSDFKYAIWGALSECNNLDRFFPSSMFNQLKDNVINSKISNRDSIDTVRNKFPLSTDRDFGGGNGIGVILTDNDLFRIWYDTALKQGKDRLMPSAVFLRLIFEGNGLLMDKVWMDLSQPSYRINSGTGYKWIYALAEVDAELGERFSSKPLLDPHSITTPFCEQLGNISMKHLNISNQVVKPLPVMINPQRQQYPLTFLSSCAKCHDSSVTVAPPIPFQNVQHFNEWLLTGNNKNKILYKTSATTTVGKMPPTRDLTDDERAAIHQYIQDINR